MRKLYALCLLTLAAVILNVVLLHERANAQAALGVRVDRIIWDLNTGPTATVQSLGHVVGFQCVKTSEGFSECFVATSSN